MFLQSSSLMDFNGTGKPASYGWCGNRIVASMNMALICAVIGTGALVPRPAQADSVAAFYKGQTITVAVGTSVGGGYDLYARMLSRFLGKHIPGQPTVVTQNMPGAGGLRLAGYLFNAAPKDGTFLGTFSRSIPTMPLFQSEAKFDGTRFTWIGSIASDTSLCITGAKSSVKSWNDLLSRPAVMGGQSTGSDADIYARLYTNVFGAKIRLIPGYPGTTEITLAMERGELDGTCGLSWSTIVSTYHRWITERSVHLLVQAGLRKDPELPHVPLATDLTDDPEKKQILNLHLAPQGMGRPFAGPPREIPADRRAALLRAFDQTMRDPEFLAAMKNGRMPVSPMTGDEIGDLVRQLFATPREIVAKAASAISR